MAPMQANEAYARCATLARRHSPYFSILAPLLSGRLRRTASVLVAFDYLTRTCSDARDKDSASRLAALAALEAQLAARDVQATDTPVLIALYALAARHNLTLELLRDLLQARRLDVTKTRYADFGELMGYCRFAVSPIARLLLQTVDAANDQNIGYADTLASALQLLDILCRVREDYQQYGRIYLPQAEMDRFKVTEQHLATGQTDLAINRLMDFQLERTRRLLRAGSPLGRILRGRNGLALRMLILGADHLITLKKQQRDDAFFRPRLSTLDWLVVGGKAFYRGFR